MTTIPSEWPAVDRSRSSIAPAPAGTYTAEVWATDGKVTQTDRVTIKLSEAC